MKIEVTTSKGGNSKLVSLVSKRHDVPSLLVLTFLAFGFIGISNHEMWRDELQAWLIARDSSSIGELFFNNLRYEGHPGLWHITLYALSRFTRNPVIMQLFHLIIATVGIYIFTRFSPFTKLQKILFTFSYFPFYEYGIISRNYVLGVLVIFCFCALFKTRHQSYILLSFILLLLANTSIYGLIIALSLGLALLFENILNYYVFQIASIRKLDAITSVLVFVFGIAIAVWQVLPPLDSGFAAGWKTNFSLKEIGLTLSTIWRSYIPIPNIFKYNLWSTNILEYLGMNEVTEIGFLLAVFFSLGFLILAVVLFIRKPVVLFAYLFGSLGILLFIHIKFFGTLRHHGHLFILFFACLWISSYYSDLTESSLLFIKNDYKRTIVNKNEILRRKCKINFLTAILSVHLLAAIFAFSSDFSHPFSESKAVAKFVQKQQISNMLIIGSRDSTVSPLSAYLDKEIYYLESKKLGSFIVWNTQRKLLTFREKLESVSKFIEKGNLDVLLLLNYDPNNEQEANDVSLVNTYLNSGARITKLASFSKSIVADENYCLYLIHHEDV